MGWDWKRAALLGPVSGIGAAVIVFALQGPSSMPGPIVIGLATAIGAGLGMAWALRSISVEAKGATPQGLAAAAAADWRLKTMKAEDAGGGAMTLTRGSGLFQDRVTLTPTAGGTTIAGPASVVNLLRKKAPD